MRKWVWGVVLAGLLGVGTAAIRGAGMPLWAYGYHVPPSPGTPVKTCTEVRPVECARGGPPPYEGLRELAGSTGKFTVKQIHDDFGPADWYPGDHPAWPDIVARGDQARGIRACGLCHYPNGQGKPENAPLAGKSAGYLLQQLDDFKAGKRKSSDPWKANATEMIAMSRALTDAEKKAAVEYFSSIPFKPWVKVVETDTVPKLAAGVNGLFTPAKEGGTEPIGTRLLETPVDADATLFDRHPRSGFVTYVPLGTLKKGESLAMTGAALVDGKPVGGRTMACGICHGPDLKGVENVPAIAGRQASYLARQMYDFQQGSRDGAMASLMKPVVANLTEDDILALVAYVASKAP